MFQRRHYEKIAAVILAQYISHPTASRQHWTSQICERTCLMFMDDNSNFDPDRFREACGLPKTPLPKEEIIA